MGCSLCFRPSVLYVLLSCFAVFSWLVFISTSSSFFSWNWYATLLHFSGVGQLLSIGAWVSFSSFYLFFIFFILLSFSPLPLQHRFASARIFCFFFCGIFKSQVKDEKSFQKYPSQIFSNGSFELNFWSETINSIHWTDHKIMLTLFWNERKSDLPLHLRWIEMKDLWYTALLFSHIGPKDMLQFFLQEMHYNFHANQTKPKGRKDDLVSWMSYVLRWYNFSS